MALHLLSTEVVTGIGGNVQWGEIAGAGTGGATRITARGTAIDTEISERSVIIASSESASFTFPFRVYSIDSATNTYRFVEGPRSFYGTLVDGVRINSTADFNSTFNDLDDWVFTHGRDSEFHLVGGGDGINIAVDNDEATWSVDNTVVREDEIPSMGNVPTNWNDLTRTGSALIPGNGIFFNDRDLALATEYRGSVGSTSEDIQVAAVAGTLEVPIGGIIEFSLGAGGLTNPLYAEGSARWDADNDEAIYYAMQLRGDDHLEELYFAKAITVAGAASPYGAVGEIELRFIGGVNIRTGAERTTYPAGITFHDRISILNNTVEAMRQVIDPVSRVQQGSQIYTEFGGLLFVSRIGDLQVQNVNVTGTGTTIAYPTALMITDGDFIMAEYPGMGLVFYRVEVDGATITNHPYTSIGTDGQPFTVPNGAYMNIRYSRLEDVVVPAGWFGVISGRANDGTTYNNNGTDVLVTRVTDPSDFWTITTAYDGTAGTDLTTVIAIR